MNYLLEINAFYDLQEINRLSSGQIALWSALMHINNKVGWMQEFTVSNQTLQFKSGLSRDGIYKARNVLKQKGYIAFKENGIGQAAKYTILRLSNRLQDSIQVSLQESIQPCLQDDIQVSLPLIKQNKTKQNIIKKPSKKSLFEGYTQNSDLLVALNAFEDMRKHSKKEMTQRAKELLLLELDKLSANVNDKDRYKVEALNMAISRGWQGVFALKDFVDSPYAFSQGEFDPEDHPTLLKPGMSVEELI